MRHYKKKVTLDRKVGPRRALLKNLLESLILSEKIVTTRAKARAIRPMVEKLVTKAKSNRLAVHRDIASTLFTKNAVSKLVKVIAPRYAERKGGYTRTVLLNNRLGDNAEEVMIEFV